MDCVIPLQNLSYSQDSYPRSVLFWGPQDNAKDFHYNEKMFRFISMFARLHTDD
jgi:hypothetical protein